MNKTDKNKKEIIQQVEIPTKVILLKNDKISVNKNIKKDNANSVLTKDILKLVIKDKFLLKEKKSKIKFLS